MVHETLWLSPDNAAEACGVSTDTIRRRISDGTLPAYRVGRLIKILETDLHRLLSRIPTVGSR